LGFVPTAKKPDRKERGESSIFSRSKFMPRGSPIKNQKSTIDNQTVPEAESRKPEAESKPKAEPKTEAVTTADRLHSAAIHLLRHVRKQDTATGEGPARLSALSVLVFGGPKTLKELAAAEQVKAPTMSRIVAGLEHSRLVDITEDPEDARRMRIAATAKGTRLLQRAREKRIADLASQLERLTPGELSQIGEAMEILAQLLRTWS
jgi:DNA-binding MarR family transcriptional regulator